MNELSKNASVYLLFLREEDNPEIVWGVYSSYMAAYHEKEILERVYRKPSMNIKVALRIEDFAVESD